MDLVQVRLRRNKVGVASTKGDSDLIRQCWAEQELLKLARAKWWSNEVVVGRLEHGWHGGVVWSRGRARVEGERWRREREKRNERKEIEEKR